MFHLPFFNRRRPNPQLGTRLPDRVAVVAPRLTSFFLMLKWASAAAITAQSAVNVLQPAGGLGTDRSPMVPDPGEHGG